MTKPIQHQPHLQEKEKEKVIVRDKDVNEELEEEGNTDSQEEKASTMVEIGENKEVFELPGTICGECKHPIVEKQCNNNYCRIPAGCFVFGAPDTAPCRSMLRDKQVQVTITYDFLIAQKETTQAEWKGLGLKSPPVEEYCADCPLSNINWYESLVYLNDLSRKDGLEECYDLSRCEGVFAKGHSYKPTGTEFECAGNVFRHENILRCSGWRLPTRAEWSYAARAGTNTLTYNGDLSVSPNTYGKDPVLEPIAWYPGNTDRLMKAKQKVPNNWGLYDVIGNVAEWVNDINGNDDIGHGAKCITNPTGNSEENSARHLMGGAFSGLPSCLCNSCTTFTLKAEMPAPIYGFRAARTIDL